MKFIKKKIYEGYFKNPEEKKREIENRKNVSNVEALSKKANELLVKKLESFINDYLNNSDETNASYNAICRKSCVGTDYYHEYLFYIPLSLFATAPTIAVTTPCTTFTSKININEESNKIELDIYVHTNWEDWKKNVRKNQEKREMFNKMGNGAESTEYDIMCNLRPDDCYKNMSNDIRLAFFKRFYYILSERQKNNTAVLSKEDKDMIDFILDGDKSVTLKKIHLFGDIQGDIKLFGYDYYNAKDRAGLSKNLKNLIDVNKGLFSFENTGNIILKDRWILAREKPIIISNNKIIEVD